MLGKLSEKTIVAAKAALVLLHKERCEQASPNPCQFEQLDLANLARLSRGTTQDTQIDPEQSAISHMLQQVEMLEDPLFVLAMQSRQQFGSTDFIIGWEGGFVSLKPTNPFVPVPYFYQMRNTMGMATESQLERLTKAIHESSGSMFDFDHALRDEPELIMLLATEQLVRMR